MGFLPGEAGVVAEAAVSEDPAGTELLGLGFVAGVLDEGRELGVGHLVSGNPEIGDLHGVDRFFLGWSGLRPHEEDAALDLHHFRGGEVLGRGGGREEERDGSKEEFLVGGSDHELVWRW